MSLSRCHFAPSSKAWQPRTLWQTMTRIMISHQNIPSPQLITTRMGESPVGLSPVGPPVNISGLQSQTGPLLELSTHFNTHLLTLTVTWSRSWALKIQTGARNEMTALEVWERQTHKQGAASLSPGPNMAPRCVLLASSMLLDQRFLNCQSSFFNKSSFHILLKTWKIWQRWANIATLSARGWS